MADQVLCGFEGHESPRVAEYGRLCPWCWQRLHSDIIDVPAMIEHLLVVAAPGVKSQWPDSSSRGGDPAERAVLSPALDDAHELHSQVAHLALEVAESRGMSGPDESGWWRSRTTTVQDPVTGEPYLRRSQVVGFHGGSGASRRLVSWLLPHLGWVSEQEWVVELRSDLGRLMATTRARWPMAETRVRDIPDVACPRCDTIGLQYAPPSWYRAPFQISCTNPQCGRVFAEDEWSRLVGLLDLVDRRKV